MPLTISIDLTPATYLPITIHSSVSIHINWDMSHHLPFVFHPFYQHIHTIHIPCMITNTIRIPLTIHFEYVIHITIDDSPYLGLQVHEKKWVIFGQGIVGAKNVPMCPVLSSCKSHDGCSH